MPLLAGVALLGGCWPPSVDDATAQAMVGEARRLRVRYPPGDKGYAIVPSQQLPPAIASVDPRQVIVYDWGVEVIVRDGFDGGWGYAIPGKAEDLPMPARCYAKRQEGLFAHRPC